MKKRLFLAIQLPKEIKDIFRDYAKKYSINGIRWTAPENLHITVYFIGYVDERDVRAIIERTKSALVKIQPFDLELQRIEFAPPNRPARMIWAVFADRNGEYKVLVDMIYNALQGFSAKDFFTPSFSSGQGKEAIAHVTLARFNNPSIAKNFNLHQPEIRDKIFTIDSLDLMESRLSRKGSAYKIIARFSLTNN